MHLVDMCDAGTFIHFTGVCGSRKFVARGPNTCSAPGTQVLAAAAFSHNQEGILFVNPIEWSQRNLFKSVSVWDVPLVKPHLSCMVDLSFSLRGYDVPQALHDMLEAFRQGAKCERGFLALDVSTLKPKAHIEFGEVVGRPMPDIADYKISVMYRSFEGDAELFRVSADTVIKHFPSAHELVVVVEEQDGDLFRHLISSLKEKAPFPLHVVTEPSLMDGHIQQKYSKVRAYLPRISTKTTFLSG